MTASEGAEAPEPASEVAANAASEPQGDADGAGRDGNATAPEPELDALRVEGLDLLRSYVDERRGGDVYIGTVNTESFAARDVHASERRRGKGGRDAGRPRPREDAEGA